MPKAEIIVGTSGFQYKDWTGFYPDGTKREDMLAFYATKFRAVELNFTYYGLPRAEQMERMAEGTPDGFEFVVKAHRTTTHEGKTEDVKPLVEGLAPLAEAGKLSGVLCQFPWAFSNTSDNRRHLSSLARAFGDVPVFVEFRHASWMKKPVFEFLRANGLLYVSVDEPELPGLLPREGKLTGDVGYIRFHSRRKSTWWGGGSGRYDYDYSDEEMSEWLSALEGFAEGARKVFVFFNNCHRGRAAGNAESFRRILEKAGLLT